MANVMMMMTRKDNQLALVQADRLKQQLPPQQELLEEANAIAQPTIVEMDTSTGPTTAIVAPHSVSLATKSSQIDFFHSKNSKILSNTLSNLSAAIVPAHLSSSSSSVSSIGSMRLLNDAIKSVSRNSEFVDSVKKSFLNSASEKRKSELKKLMEDVLIEQQKSVSSEKKSQLEVKTKKPPPPPPPKTTTTTTALVRPPPNAIVSATTNERITVTSNGNSSAIINSNNNISIGNNKLVKAAAPTTIRVVTMMNKPTPANVDLIEQSKNQTLKALISGPYSNRKIPLPPPESSIIISKTLSPISIVQDNKQRRVEENKSITSDLAGLVEVCGKQLISPPMVEVDRRVVSSDERRLSELKNEIIDLVRTNTASSFPVEENTSSATANKKLVHELNEKETSMAKSMNKNIGYLESTLSKFQAKKEIINNFLKLKNLLNNGTTTTTTTTANNETNGGGAQMSSKEASNIKKLSMRSLSSSFTNGIGCAPPNGTRTLDAEQMTHINELKVDNSIKRLNLYSSIKSKNIPKIPNRIHDTSHQKLEEEMIADEETEDIEDDDEDDEMDDHDEVEVVVMIDDDEDEGVGEFDDEDDDEEEDNEEDEEEEGDDNDDQFEDIMVRKRLTEPHVYVRGKGRGKFECSKCGWRARKLCVLKRHIMVSHANFKPFLCTYCKCAFKTKGNLVRHTKTKAHLRACSKLGMSASDEEVTRITSKNIDNSQLSKQLKIDKKIKLS